MHRIILITQQEAVTREVKRVLQPLHCEVRTVAPATVAEGEFTPDRPELVIGVAPSAAEARQLCRTVRGERTLTSIPLILLVPTAEISAIDVSWGFDDFAAWPVTGLELVQRVRTLFWRAGRVDLTNGLKVGELVLDFERYEVLLHGRRLDLTYKEYELLRFLAARPGKVFTREELLNHVWGYEYFGGTRTVDVHIRRLRTKLSPTHATLIETVRNVGYKFSPLDETPHS